MTAAEHAGLVRVGIGGWDYQPWRGSFFPPGLPKSRELAFASRALTAIEVNSTFYKTHNPETFRRWAAETPDGFKFALKAPRYVVNRRVLAESADGIARFLESGLTELGAKLGPILWQLPPTRAFQVAELTAFLSLLPRSFAGLPLQHALEVRHSSFVDPSFVALARGFGIPVVYADSDIYPAIANNVGSFVYARLQLCQEAEQFGYNPEQLRLWAERARLWASGESPPDLAYVDGATTETGRKRPVYIFFINGAKVRAPAAAQALLAQLGVSPK